MDISLQQHAETKDICRVGTIAEVACSEGLDGVRRFIKEVSLPLAEDAT